MGWSFSPDDVFDHDALSFAVLHDFPAGRAANVLIGESHDGHSTCAFDYVVPTPATATGNTRFTCVLTDLSQEMPGLLVLPGLAADRLVDPRRLTDTEIDGANFDALFRTHADDGTFARLFLDISMRAWLADDWPVAGLEISGSLLLTWGPALPPRRIRDAVSAADALRARIPEAARTHAIEHVTGHGGDRP